MQHRIGQGYDCHLLSKHRQSSQIRLGGINILSKYQIVAHSDGDVVLHAISNAILGTIQKGDIGEYFPDIDPQNRGLNSTIILKHVLKLLRQAKYQIVNIDLTIQCQNIYLMEHKRNIAISISKLTKCSLVNVKATRFEQPTSLIACNVIILTKRR
ncbi:MAG: 2-C-methyl-D-erythritol 2,4-cyclodiphosphate synthase [Mycoplasmataceae bacterium]|jgi:2-C-methyl-D-erythritol 2,4-cyclodiphosphate synthase|nr:2-C-methyl-D-erythritol 2,4-cyclodiphosphate synthase [Mycoplasmataceae bacterium]